MIKVQIHNGIHCIDDVPVVQFCWAAHDDMTCIHTEKKMLGLVVSQGGMEGGGGGDSECVWMFRMKN